MGNVLGMNGSHFIYGNEIINLQRSEFNKILPSFGKILLQQLKMLLSSFQCP